MILFFLLKHGVVQRLYKLQIWSCLVVLFHQAGSDVIYCSNMEEIMGKKYPVSSCAAPKWWSACLNKLLTLQIKLPEPFYFGTILLKPNMFSLRVPSCFFHARPFPHK